MKSTQRILRKQCTKLLCLLEGQGEGGWNKGGSQIRRPRDRSKGPKAATTSPHFAPLMGHNSFSVDINTKSVNLTISPN